MATRIQKSLFQWSDVETYGDINRFQLVRNYLPDESLMQALEKRRGRGRNEYNVRAMWNAIIAGIVYQHASIESLRRELGRNPALAEECGFEAMKPIPKSWNFSRLLQSILEIEAKEGLLGKMFQDLRDSLMELLPDYGKHLGYDGKFVKSYSTGNADKETGLTSDPDALWGMHKISGVDQRGNAWEKITKVFGYKIHLIADTKYELPVNFTVTPASKSELNELKKMLTPFTGDLKGEDQVGQPKNDLSQKHPISRCKDFCADRGLDDGSLKAGLLDRLGIYPLIDTRQLWRDGKKSHPTTEMKKDCATRPLYPNRADTIVYSEKGNVYCHCPKTNERRELSFYGFERDRKTLKYRCPAATNGFECKGKALCHQCSGTKDTPYGRVIRISLNATVDRRVFTPVPHGSPSWVRGYKRRTSLERINARIDRDFGFERHYIRGGDKMRARVTLSFIAMMAMAVGHITEKRYHLMRSLVEPIPVLKIA